MSGIFVKGTVVHSRATARKRKDGSGVFVIVEHEIALCPGVARVEQFIDPASGDVVLEGLEVKSFPQWEQFKEIALRVEKFRFVGEQVVITRFEKIDSAREEEPF